MTIIHKFDFDAGELCLDFVNTAEWHDTEQPIDRLNDFADLVAWGEAAGLVSAEEADDLRHLAEERGEESVATYDKAIHLREAIYRIFGNLSGDERVDAVDLGILNVALSRSLPHLRIAAVDSGFGWDWEDRAGALDQILWPVARSAGELLTSKTLDRIRKCADDRGCGYLFVDMSRNRSRRWCSMESCGNRAKATRHYKRKREVHQHET